MLKHFVLLAYPFPTTLPIDRGVAWEKVPCRSCPGHAIVTRAMRQGYESFVLMLEYECMDCRFRELSKR